MAQPQLKYTIDDQHHHIWMLGDKLNQIEPPEVTIHFPGGKIGVARCSDNTYWAHFDLEGDDENQNREFKSKVIDCRIDCKDISVNEADLGSLTRPDMSHVAIKLELL